MIPTGSTLGDINFYMCDVDKDSGLLQGYQINNGDISARQVWSMAVPKSHQILFAAGKPFNEKVCGLLLMYLYVYSLA